MDCQRYLWVVASEIRTFTPEEKSGPDLRVKLTRLAMMPKRSFNIYSVILHLNDFVDDLFDALEFSRVPKNEQFILNKVIVPHHTRLVISAWRQGG